MYAPRMKPLRPIFTFSILASANLKTIKNSNYFSFSTLIQQNPFPSNSVQRQKEEARTVQVSVWWDFENCHLPASANVYRVAQCITNALRANGIKGPIRITAFGDVMQISRNNQEALSSTGINLTHVPSGGKNSADRSLLVDLMYWVSQNPPPAHLFLISGDRDFAGILHRLRMNNYNILLASPDSAPSVLCSAATIMWQWSSLLKGENLSGRLFNHPPDGPYNSWYGHYKAPLEDPFEIMEQASCLPAEETSELASDSKLRPIPKAVVKHIHHILNSYPEGIPISQFRAELAKSNLTLDVDLYGYKKLSRFLLAMPHVLKLHRGNDGFYLVRGVDSKNVDESVPTASSTPLTNEREQVTGGVQKSIVPQVPKPRVQDQVTNFQEAHKQGKESDVSPKTNMQDMKLRADETQMKFRQNGFAPAVNTEDIKVKAHATILQERTKDEKQSDFSTQETELDMGEPNKRLELKLHQGKDEVASPVTVSSDSSKLNTNEWQNAKDDSSTYLEILRRIWTKWLGSGDAISSGKNLHKENGVLMGMDKTEMLMSSQPAGYISPALFSPSSHEALIDGKIIRNGNSDTQTIIVSPDSILEKNLGTVGAEKDTSEKAEHFANESFWKELETFICTTSGSALVSQSMTRGHLVQNLQKRGPAGVRSLSETDLLHLVDELISNKKWVEECDSRVYPFKLTRLTGKDPLTNPSSSLNGLSHMFLHRQQNIKDFGEKKHQNPPHTGVPQPSSSKSSSSKPRNEILSDCQKVVDHVMKEHPEGFNLGSFRKVFIEKCGYALDLQKLGYEKLVNLLQIMPGVRIESTLILPAEPFKNLGLQNSDLPIQESSKGGESSKDEDSDSSWDELGPLNNSGSKKEEIVPRFSENGKNIRIGQTIADYEPLEEDEFTDSEDEASSYRSENGLKSKVKGEESSLLEILDLHHSRKDGDAKDETVGPINVPDSSSDSDDSGTKTELASVNTTRKPKSGKKYSFVAEQPGDSSDKLVNSILGKLKTSGGPSDDSKLLG